MESLAYNLLTQDNAEYLLYGFVEHIGTMNTEKDHLCLKTE